MIGEFKNKLFEKIHDKSLNYTAKAGESLLYMGHADEYDYYMCESGKFYVSLVPGHLCCLGDDPFVFISWLNLQ